MELIQDYVGNPSIVGAAAVYCAAVEQTGKVGWFIAIDNNLS
jgi:hypothetical protein